MKLTTIIQKLAPLAVAMSMACSPAQMQPVTDVISTTPITQHQESTQEIVTHKISNVTYVPVDQNHFKSVNNTSYGYGRIHGLGKLDNGYGTGRDADVSIGTKRRSKVPKLVLRAPKRQKPTPTDHYKNQSDELTKHACRSYVSSIQNGRKNSEGVLHFGPRSKLEKECIKSSKRMCSFDKIKDNRTDNRYRSCVKTSMYEGFIKPGF
jgi:hypothetical protein